MSSQQDSHDRIGYIEMSTGISGDMFVGAMIEAGCPIDRLRQGLAKTGLIGVRLEAQRVTRHGLGGTKFLVVEEARASRAGGPGNLDQVSTGRPETEPTHGHGRGFSEIRRMIQGSDLPNSVREQAIHVFQAIGEAEAHIHNTTIEGVHFHEVGAVDSIADIVCACLAVHELEVRRLYASEVTLSCGGTVIFSHGIVPTPTPATLELLKGIPTRTTDLKSELVTPTGAALLRVLCHGFGPRPDMVVERIGYGAGTKDFPDRANLLRVCIGKAI